MKLTRTMFDSNKSLWTRAGGQVWTSVGESIRTSLTSRWMITVPKFVLHHSNQFHFMLAHGWKFGSTLRDCLSNLLRTAVLQWHWQTVRGSGQGWNFSITTSANTTFLSITFYRVKNPTELVGTQVNSSMEWRNVKYSKMSQVLFSSRWSHRMKEMDSQRNPPHCRAGAKTMETFYPPLTASQLCLHTS